MCVYLSVCLSVCLSALSRSHFLIDFRQNGHKGITTRKIRMNSLGVNIAPPLPYFAPNLPFWTNYADFCFKYSQIAGILASYRKSGSINTLVTSDFRTEVEIRQFCACTLKNMQCSHYLWLNRRNFCALRKGWCYFQSVRTEIKCNYSLFSVRMDGNLYAYTRYFPSVRREIYS